MPAFNFVLYTVSAMIATASVVSICHGIIKESGRKFLFYYQLFALISVFGAIGTDIMHEEQGNIFLINHILYTNEIYDYIAISLSCVPLLLLVAGIQNNQPIRQLK